MYLINRCSMLVFGILKKTYRILSWGMVAKTRSGSWEMRLFAMELIFNWKYIKQHDHQYVQEEISIFIVLSVKEY